MLEIIPNFLLCYPKFLSDTNLHSNIKKTFEQKIHNKSNRQTKATDYHLSSKLKKNEEQKIKQKYEEKSKTKRPKIRSRDFLLKTESSETRNFLRGTFTAHMSSFDLKQIQIKPKF